MWWNSLNVPPGNARLQGLQTQLHLVGNHFNIALVSEALFRLAETFDKLTYLLTDNVFHCGALFLLPRIQIMTDLIL